MYCKNCGFLIKETDKICLNCGTANFPEAADIRSEDEALPDERSPREMANTVFSMGLLGNVGFGLGLGFTLFLGFVAVLTGLVALLTYL